MNSAPWLTSLGAHVRGIARNAGIRDGVEVYSEDKLSELLPETDALVMILPGSDATKHVLNAERLKQLPNHAWIVNVGEYDLEQNPSRFQENEMFADGFMGKRTWYFCR